MWYPPHLTFTNDWAGVISPFLDYAENQLSQYVDSSRIVLEGKPVLRLRAHPVLLSHITDLGLSSLMQACGGLLTLSKHLNA